MCAPQLNPNNPNQCFTASPVRAREHQIRALKKCILGRSNRGSYVDIFTVYPYNGHIRRTNSIVRHVMSLTCTLKWIHVNYSAPMHAKTQPLHYSNLTQTQTQTIKHKHASLSTKSVTKPLAQDRTVSG